MVADLRRNVEFNKEVAGFKFQVSGKQPKTRNVRPETDFDIFEPNKGFILPKGASFIFTAFNDERTGF